MAKSPKIIFEKSILVGIRHPQDDDFDAQESFSELERLSKTAGARVIATVYQEVKRVDPATYIGRGKVAEIADLIEKVKADSVLFDVDLSPGQHRNLEKQLRSKVVDRTGLILDIFAQHAQSKEGKLQVELAQYIYLMPRLVGQWGHFGKLGGGIGTRGPGETQLEVDRRRAREKISQIRHELRAVEKSRKLHRQKREGVPIPTVALVGYTNAGKSTLMRALTGADVLVEDKLFATLDPTVRRLKLPSGLSVLLSDTVGFIHKLPHQLVEAFKATFEEVRAANILLHVIDASHRSSAQQRDVVRNVLHELKLDNKPILEVYNKIDLLGPSGKKGEGVRISGEKNLGLNRLLEAIDRELTKNFRELRVQIPYPQSAILPWLYEVGKIRSRRDREDGIHLKISLSPVDEGRLREVALVKVSSK